MKKLTTLLIAATLLSCSTKKSLRSENERLKIESAQWQKYYIECSHAFDECIEHHKRNECYENN